MSINSSNEKEETMVMNIKKDVQHKKQYDKEYNEPKILKSKDEYIFSFNRQLMLSDRSRWENFEISRIINFLETKDDLHVSELESMYAILRLLDLGPFIKNMKDKPAEINYEPFFDLYKKIDMKSTRVKHILEDLRYQMEYRNSLQYYNTYVDMVNKGEL